MYLLGLGDNEFPCVHAIAAAVSHGKQISQLYDSNRVSLAHFRNTYDFCFLPWPKSVSLATDPLVQMPSVRVDKPESGKRGAKPGPKPKHKRKIAKTQSNNVRK